MSFDFEQTLADNQSRIRAIAWHYADVGHSDDLYQEILLQLWRSRHSYKSRSSVSTWIYKVALNTAFTFQRKSIRQRKIHEQALSVSLSEHAEGGYSDGEILGLFMQQLNDVDKSVLIMYLDGIPAAGISETLGLSANAINVRVNRLKSRFEEQFIS
ncbi:MAG: RNA polymerase sigma factor [Pseudomonadota bacterium]